MLSGKEIKKQIDTGRIRISGFDESRLGSDSYDVTLANILMFYTETPLDAKRFNQTREITIPSDGILLAPNRLYLGRTREHISTDYYVPVVDGVSSCARLGILVHATAGNLHVGFSGFPTLEIWCVEPVRIYAGMPIGQITFEEIVGEFELYKGRYSAKETQASASYLNFVDKQTSEDSINYLQQ